MDHTVKKGWRGGCVHLTKTLSELRESLASRGSVTTTAITALFTVTWTPTVVRFIYSSFAGEDRVPAVLEQMRYLFFIACWGNPVLFVYINQGFRRYFTKFCKRKSLVYFVEPWRVISETFGSIRSGVGKVSNMSKRSRIGETFEEEYSSTDQYHAEISDHPQRGLV